MLRTVNKLGTAYIHLEQYEMSEELLKAGMDLCESNIDIGIQNLTAS